MGRGADFLDSIRQINAKVCMNERFRLEQRDATGAKRL